MLSRICARDLNNRLRCHTNRSQAIEDAVVDEPGRLDRKRLALEYAKLDPADEKELAEEDLSGEISGWPEY
jgi:hypothetical protein